MNAHDNSPRREQAEPALKILCVMRMPPNLDGHGGSQRAWRLLEALLPHGEVHFVLVYRDMDGDCVTTSLDPILPLVASVTRIDIPGWQPTLEKKFGVVPAGVSTLIRMGSQEAPQLSDAQLSGIASQLPLRNPHLIFAGRLCTAFILQALIDKGLLAAERRVVDFDDVMSNLRTRQVRTAGEGMGLQKRIGARIDAFLIKRAEARVARLWDGISVCADDDVASLKAKHPKARVIKVPNVLDRPRLAPRSADGRFRLLFVGNLSFSANVDGLQWFMEEGWPEAVRAIPNLLLTVAGINPSPRVYALSQRQGVELHANVPSLQPFYAGCDAVIAPILFGSGTRIKILEAMAYGRPVVSTSMGAEGLGLVDRRHCLLADTPGDFVRSIVELANDTTLRETLATAAHAFQRDHYSPSALHAAVTKLIETDVPAHQAGA